MDLKDLTRRQVGTVLAVVLLLVGLVLVPPLMQKFYGVSAVKVAFGIIILYAGLNWWMKNRQR